MELWQLDFIEGVFFADGTECKVVTEIDAHSHLPQAGDGRGPGPTPQADQHSPPLCLALPLTQSGGPLGVARAQPRRAR